MARYGATGGGGGGGSPNAGANATGIRLTGAAAQQAFRMMASGISFGELYTFASNKVKEENAAKREQREGLAAKIGRFVGSLFGGNKSGILSIQGNAYCTTCSGDPLDEVVITATPMEKSSAKVVQANGSTPAIWEEYQHETAIPGLTYTAKRFTPYGEIWAAEQRALDWNLFRRFTPLGRAINASLSIYEMTKGKTDHLKGGKQNQRDSDIKQYPTEFQRWYHREHKSPGDPNATRTELNELFKEWNRIGQPRAK